MEHDPLKLIKLRAQGPSERGEKAMAVPEQKSGPVSFEEAKEIFGEDYYGAIEYAKIFGRSPSEKTQEIPFSREYLKYMHESGFSLLYQFGHTPEGIPMTAKNMLKLTGRHALLGGSFDENDSCLTNEKPNPGWRLISRQGISFSDCDFIEQTKNQINIDVDRLIPENKKLSIKYADAFDVFQNEIPDFEHDLELQGGDTVVAHVLKKMKAVTLLRESLTEAVYRKLLMPDTLIENDVWSVTRSVTNNERFTALYDGEELRIFTTEYFLKEHENLHLRAGSFISLREPLWE